MTLIKMIDVIHLGLSFSEIVLAKWLQEFNVKY